MAASRRRRTRRQAGRARMVGAEKPSAGGSSSPLIDDEPPARATADPSRHRATPQTGLPPAPACRAVRRAAAPHRDGFPLTDRAHPRRSSSARSGESGRAPSARRTAGGGVIGPADRPSTHHGATVRCGAPCRHGACRYGRRARLTAVEIPVLVPVTGFRGTEMPGTLPLRARRRGHGAPSRSIVRRRADQRLSPTVHRRRAHRDQPRVSGWCDGRTARWRSRTPARRARRTSRGPMPRCSRPATPSAAPAPSR
ncbi:hypothetical protein UA74_11310 [Actinoalloteichus fjordicus]|uniref:Uncharacterized protein n=1 Tax=Actinoalloteichus fjordicus TaxID=1612552 RepID=A0AAC9LB31_9PSEU|nr:hypothetical protein UA74_11310 [Actinoalloteichus fjordicus]